VLVAVVESVLDAVVSVVEAVVDASSRSTVNVLVVEAVTPLYVAYTVNG
jgi:hypothetical protein